MPGLVGCSYCRDLQIRNFGHLTHLAVEDDTGIHLVRCPKCAILYEDNSHDDPTPVSSADAQDRWGFTVQ